jgi:hypothetical protein
MDPKGLPDPGVEVAVEVEVAQPSGRRKASSRDQPDSCVCLLK